MEASDAFGAYTTVGTDEAVAQPSVIGGTQPCPDNVGGKCRDGGPSHPDDQFPVLLMMTRVNGVVERLVEDLPALESTAEPTDAIGREVARAIDLLHTLEGRIAR